MAFVDFAKAFDTVEWNAIWLALSMRGVHHTLIHLLRQLYEASQTEICVKGHSVPVQVRRGIRQGDTLSPKLFTATLSMALNDIDWSDMGLKMGDTILSSLEYADDVVLMASTKTQLEKMLLLLRDACVKIGLSINMKKTVLMTSCKTTRSPINIDGESIKFAEEVTYLGSKITIPLEPGREIEARIRSAWSAFIANQDLLCSRSVPFRLKKKVFDSCVSPALLYSAETWTLRGSDRERMAVTQRRMERKMIGITLLDKWTNERVREKTKVKDWNKMANGKKIEWAKKIAHMDPMRPAKLTTDWIPSLGNGNMVDLQQDGETKSRRWYMTSGGEPVSRNSIML